MLIEKTDLLKLLRLVVNFDSTASPFVVIQLQEESLPLFYRSSALGFIQSKDFSPSNVSKNRLVNVSLSHFQDCLKVLREEKIEIGVDANGILKIASTDNTFESELRVHTVPASHAGVKSHDIGEIKHRFDSNAFLGIDTSSFKTKVPPVLSNGRLMLATSDAVVIWDGPDTLKTASSYPRESFLRITANNSSVTQIVLTSKEYWGVVIGELVVFTFGHKLGHELFELYSVPSTELVRIPADRLIYSLKAAAGLIGEKDRIDVDPKVGVLAKNRFGSDARFSLGGTQGWTKFGIFGGTAQAIVDALSQSKEEEAVLSSVSMTHPTLRLKRGSFEVNFKTI